ncbi:hypothetical protein PRIPAC_76229, partial [Pristionchus pacificus]
QMIRQSILLAISFTLSTAFECNPNNACDNEIALCGEGSKCMNPSGKPLGGCCVPEGTKMDETEQPAVADYVKENCGHAFACDNEIASCYSHSKCVNPSGQPLSGCCIPNEMDTNEMKNGLPSADENGEVEKVSEWEHLRGVVADYVIDNCGPAFACDNQNYGCGDHSKCVNPSGEMLSGCCIPNTMDPNEMEKGLPQDSTKKISEWEHLRGVVADYVIDNCGPAFACDNTDYGCGDHSKCVNPSGEMLSGCCIPKGMDPNEMERGLPLESASYVSVEKKISEWEHLRGVVADYVIDNCGPAFACDNTDYGCADHSKCINPSGEMLSGCCIPTEMDVNNFEKGLPEKTAETEVDVHAHLRGAVADYVIENCGIAFACDGDYGCADHSQCVNPSGDTMSGCCIPKTMDPNEMDMGLPLPDEGRVKETETVGPSDPASMRGLISDYVADYCGPAFACDHNGATCREESECVNPSGEVLSGCCVPKGMTREDLEGTPSSADSINYGSLNGIDLKSIVAPYVLEFCGPAFACDDIGAHCDDESSCINPSEGLLAGCCVPKGMTRENLEGTNADKFEPKIGEFGTLNGIDLKSLIDPYVMENCGPAFACDDIGAHCAEHSSCINPSAGPLAGCCVPNGMTREELETGVLNLKTKTVSLNEEAIKGSESICSASAGQCIPRVFMANETKYREEL